jgi:hypothetical protein
MTRTRGLPEPEGDADSEGDVDGVDGVDDGEADVGVDVEVHAASRAPKPRGPVALRTARRLTSCDTGIL